MSRNSAYTVTIASLTHTSIGPSLSSISSAALSTASASATSSGTTSAWPPRSSTSRAAPSRPLRPRAISATRAPSSANRRAAARPIPPEAPVITTTSPRLLTLLLLAPGVDQLLGRCVNATGGTAGPVGKRPIGLVRGLVARAGASLQGAAPDAVDDRRDQRDRGERHEHDREDSAAEGAADDGEDHERQDDWPEPHTGSDLPGPPAGESRAAPNRRCPATTHIP